jgi:endo-beta-N-acetylglucosaminidase D
MPDPAAADTQLQDFDTPEVVANPQPRPAKRKLEAFVEAAEAAFEAAEKAEKTEKAEKAEKAKKAETAEKAEKAEKADAADLKYLEELRIDWSPDGNDDDEEIFGSYVVRFCFCPR